MNLGRLLKKRLAAPSCAAPRIAAPRINERRLRFFMLCLFPLCAACLGGVAGAQTRELSSSGQMLDGIAAVVDDGVVLKSELASRTDLVMQQLQTQQAKEPADQRRPLPTHAVIQKQVLDQLVLKQVELQRAKRLGITVSDQMLNQALAQVAQNLGVTFGQLPAALASQNVDYAMYREDSRDQLVIQQLLQRDVLSHISVTPRELKQCLERTSVTQANDRDYNLSHILVSVPPAATQQQLAAAHKKLQEIYDKLGKGEDFAQLAITYSDSETALQGGSLGWRKGSELPTVFAEVVPKLKPGEYSQPIQSASGFHIVKLNAVRGTQRVVKDQIRVRHILLKPNAVMDDDAVRQRLLGIRQEISKGQDFGPIAKAISEDAVSAADGGDLGWITIGSDDFPPEFETQIDKLKVGEISQPFKTRYGWHLAEVTNKRSHDMTDELKQQQCDTQVRNSKAQEERELWLRRLRDQAYVDERGM
ncbi:MAG TPA: peptidylprolyl isomerase [Gammaproteobacteria bacterium]|nr:peptidylprolyl isomerase [Gammaproteobacteria bacterium]